MKKHQNVPEQADENSRNASAPEQDTAEEKLDIKQSVFQTNKELRRQRELEYQQQQQKIQHELELREKRKREAYEKKIREEKIELMRLKQGLIEESETIQEEHEEPVKLTFWSKIVNFFYHNKWWFGIGAISACIVGFLVYSLVTKPRPDIVVLVIADNEELGEMSELQSYVESFSDDFNGNGKTLASIYYIPYSDNQYKNYAQGADDKLTSQLQSADSVIVIGGTKLDQIMAPDPESYFVDLKSVYPDNPHVKGYKFLLKNTPFADRIKLDPQFITDDLYIAVRVPTKLLYTSKKDMEKTFEKDWDVFDKIVKDLSE